MKSAQLSALLAIPALLTGCGGGSEGGSGNSAPSVPSAPKYTWQIVSLKSESSVASGCATLGTVASTGNVIAVYEATDNFNILIHNPDGSVKSTINTNGSSKVVIDSASVPDDGFVSLEEIDGSIGGNNDVYMFAVEKDLLSNMTLNVRQFSNSYTCYKGEQFSTANINVASVVKVDQVSGSTQYYQTSYIDNAVDGHNIAAKIPVKSPLPAQEKVLVTLFNSYAANQATDLTHYAIMNGSSVYNVADTGTISGNPTDQNILTPTLDALTLGTLSNTASSRIDANIGSHIYTWQPIYALDQEYSVIDGNSDIKKWSLNLTISDNNNWAGKVFAPVETNGTTIAAPTLTALATNISSSCTIGDFCVSSASFDDSEVDLQRTHIRSQTTNSSRSFYQTILASAKNEQVLMQSSSERLAPTTGDRVEISLAKVDQISQAKVEHFLSWSINPEELVSSSPANFNDVNGFISMPSDDKERRIAIMGSELQMYRSSVN
ncbi:hypothetical protein BIY21_18395 [Vibrio ponticus]|uniref:Flagellar sheath protein A n=1 Tax=Vibrio ponticus TaxID=265668 RepID=A0ABX3F6X9_9VIBR|nr:hypothetical protein [Vibrio ponticus]OLQ86184.1 hypothetical protein BIY21_18395 [Vibrio ponticus]